MPAPKNIVRERIEFRSKKGCRFLLRQPFYIVGALFTRPDKSAVAIYDQAYRACLDLKDKSGAEKYRALAEL